MVSKLANSDPSSFLLNGSWDSSQPLFIFAHGAGLGMDSPWIEMVTQAIIYQDINLLRFEFPYMAERRKTGKKKFPDKTPLLLESWKSVYQYAQKKTSAPIFIGGKSMGGRMASLIADQLKPRGLICLGFPFHAPYKDPQDRISHLKKIKTPTLICQGTRDPMGNYKEVHTYDLSSQIKIHWLEDANHDFQTTARSMFNFQQHIEETSNIIKGFINSNM